MSDFVRLPMDTRKCDACMEVGVFTCQSSYPSENIAPYKRICLVPEVNICCNRAVFPMLKTMRNFSVFHKDII